MELLNQADTPYRWTGFQSPISGVNDWNLMCRRALSRVLVMFQSPISGVNDWNEVSGGSAIVPFSPSFSLLLAELMIGTYCGYNDRVARERFSLLLAELMIGTGKAVPIV